MMFFPSPRTAASLCAAVSLITLQATAAYAFDPTGNQVADAFLSVLDAQDGTVESYGSVTEAGNAVTIRDLVISNETDNDAKVTIASTVLSGGEVLDNGRLKLDSLGLETLELTADDGGMSLETLSVSELVLPSAEEAAANDAPVSPGYRTFDVKNIQVRDEDGKVADIQAIASSIDSMDGDLPTSGSFSLSGATIDVKQLEVEEAKSLSELGYDTLSLDINASGRWDPEAATINIPELKIDAKDAASLSIALSLGGVTREVVEQIEEKSENPEEAMALLQNVTLVNAKIRLDDASLTGRVLDQEAQKAGVEVPAYVAGLTQSLPLMLGMLQNKELEGQVAQAVTAFLNAPGSLELVAAPGAPVPFSQVMGTAMLAPQMIPQILSVGITANQ